MELLLTILTLSLLVAALIHLWGRSEKGIFSRLLWTLFILVCPILGGIIYFILYFFKGEDGYTQESYSAGIDFPDKNDRKGIERIMYERFFVISTKAEYWTPKWMQDELEDVIAKLKEAFEYGELTYQLFSNGAYIGFVSEDNKREGIGMYMWEDGNIYVGEWEDNNLDGMGFHYTQRTAVLSYARYVNDKAIGTKELYSPNGHRTVLCD